MCWSMSNYTAIDGESEGPSRPAIDPDHAVKDLGGIASDAGFLGMSADARGQVEAPLMRPTCDDRSVQLATRKVAAGVRTGVVDHHHAPGILEAKDSQLPAVMLDERTSVFSAATQGNKLDKRHVVRPFGSSAMP